jgi:hypothetical protein
LPSPWRSTGRLLTGSAGQRRPTSPRRAPRSRPARRASRPPAGSCATFALPLASWSSRSRSRGTSASRPAPRRAGGPTRVPELVVDLLTLPASPVWPPPPSRRVKRFLDAREGRRLFAARGIFGAGWHHEPKAAIDGWRRIAEIKRAGRRPGRPAGMGGRSVGWPARRAGGSTGVGDEEAGAGRPVREGAARHGAGVGHRARPRGPAPIPGGGPSNIGRTSVSRSCARIFVSSR